MSCNILYLVPRDPEWQPTRDAAECAAEMLKTIAMYPQAIAFSFYDRLHFFDCSENWMGVTCPHCGADVESWFFPSLEELMPTARRSGLDVMTPCCSRGSNLSEMVFGFHCAFGSFAIRGEDAGAVPDAAMMKRLEAAIGAPLIDVWMHV